MDLNQVREGMHVVDAAGNQVGKVREVRIGDPSAVSEDGQIRDEDASFLNPLGHGFRGQVDLSDEEREHLVRTGYIRVNAPGLEQDFFEDADSVGRVEEDVVYLTVTHHH